MKKIRVKSWVEFQDKLTEIETRRTQTRQSDSNKISYLLFRGQSDACWRLETTLERQAGPDISAIEYFDLIRHLKHEIEAHSGRAWKGLDSSESADELEKILYERRPPQPLEFMAYLRHHSFPSPLLDWTASPYVAAYFAFREAKRGVDWVSIYVMNAEDVILNERGSTCAPQIGLVGHTIKAHKRHFSQQSQYTYCREKVEGRGCIYTSHERAFDEVNEYEQERLWKITIPASERKTVLKYLEAHNVTSFSLFHSEESLMETLALREFTLRR